MAHSIDDDHDMYVAQLKEVFDSCDGSDTGRLTKPELEQLCIKLQLEDQSEALVKQLIGDNEEKKITFDEFKEGFVAVLSEAVDGISSDEELEYDTDLGTTGGTVSPKFFRGRRRYGRRTLPDSSEGEGTISLKYGRRTLPDSSEGEGTMGTTDFSEYSSRTRSSRGHTSSRVSSFDVEEEPAGSHDDVDGPHPSQSTAYSQPQKDAVPETFEAEGEVNQNIADMENALDPVSEEEHLKEIWRELGVGKSGYLTIHELATVCEHIGMDEMNQEELEHLFAKLDTDGDGNVSFQEFLQGLFQHGGPMTPSPAQLSRLSPSRPLSTPSRLKNKLAASFDAQDRQTPSFGTHGSGLFSEIDPDNTGYASGEAVIELWQSLGIPQGAEVLEFLQFDVHNKINLTELSYALEQELRSVEDDNAPFQVAVAAYEHEFIYQRNNSEHLTAERNKLRSDLNEASNRISLLVKEADERNVALEKAKEKELAQLESKYEDQIRGLHAEMEQERETLLQQANKQRLKLEQELEVYKEEEAKLRDKVVFCQKELDKMEEEMFEVMEQCSDLERTNVKLQKELQGTDELRTKLEELESQRANILDEQEKFSGQKLLQLEQENKELRDQNDELTMEVEDLTQQVSSTRKQRKLPRQNNASPLQLGSKFRESASENSDDDILSPTSQRRRFLPQQPSISDDGSVYGGPEGQDTKGSQQGMIQEMERGFSIERKDIEDAFKMEIADLEDKQIREKNDMVKQFNLEKDAWSSEFAEKLQASLIEKECNLREVLDKEKQDMTIIHESEISMLEHNYAQEKSDLIRRMRQEFESELEHKLDTQRQEYMKELEQTVTRDSTTDEDFKKQISELQLQLKLQEEELQMKFRQQMAKLQEEFEAQKAILDERNRLQILDLDNIFTQGVDGLKGKLKADFEALLEQHRQVISAEERNQQVQALAGEKDAIIEEFTRQQEHIVRKLKKERREAEQNNKAEIQQLKHTLDKERDTWHSEKKQVQLQMQMERDAIQSQLQQTMSTEHQQPQLELQQVQSALEQDRRDLELERQSLHAQFEAGVQRERDQLERERGSLRQLMEEEVSRELHAQMEDEFLEQMERVKGAFSEEQAQLEGRVQMLQEELDDINRTRDMEERFRQQMETQSKDLELKNRNQVEELRTSNEKLRRENEKLEKELQEKALGHEPAIVTTHIPKTHTSTDALRDKLILDAISQQSRLLVDRTSEIHHALKSIHRDPPYVVMLKEDNERLVEEKKVLQEQIGELNNQLLTAQEATFDAEQHKSQLEKWELERASLHEQLEITTDKLVSLNMTISLKDSEHLREIQRLNDKLSQTVSVAKYNNLNAKVMESEKKARALAVALEERASETNKLIQGLRKDNERAMQHLQKEKENIEHKLNLTQQLLDTQIKKLKQQLEHASRLDILVKELYVENSNLMKCLELSEKRGVKAESRVYGLEEKCRTMNRVLKKVGTAALV